MSVRVVIGAYDTRAVIANSLGRKPVNGGIPPMDRRSAASGSQNLGCVSSGALVVVEVSIFSTISRVNTGIRIVEYSEK